MPFISCYSRVDGKDTCCLGFSLNRTTGNCESKCTVYYILLSSNWYDKTNFHYFRHRYINTSSLRIIILCRSCSYCIWTKCINKFIFVRYILHFFVECSIGFYGKGCLQKCIYPFFGEDCQYVCHCPKDDCHFSHGCLPRAETVSYQKISMCFHKH